MSFFASFQIFSKVHINYNFLHSFLYAFYGMLYPKTKIKLNFKGLHEEADIILYILSSLNSHVGN